MQLCSKPRGARNRTRDLPKKGSAFITSSDHWTIDKWRPRQPELGAPTPRPPDVRLLPMFQLVPALWPLPACEETTAESRDVWPRILEVLVLLKEVAEYAAGMDPSPRSSSRGIQCRICLRVGNRPVPGSLQASHRLDVTASADGRHGNPPRICRAS